MRGKYSVRPAMPPSFGLPPMIQWMSPGNAASAVAALSALVALLSLMNSVRSMRPISSRRCGRPGNVASAAATSPGVTPAMRQAALAASAFWMLWRPRRGPRPARSANAPSGPVHGACADQLGALRVPAVRHALVGRQHVDPAAVGEPQPLADLAAPVVVLADNGSPRGLDQARLQGRVVLDGAVPVEVIGRDVEQHADAGIERRRQLDLEGRHLDDVEPIDGRRLQRQDRRADVAAHLHVAAGRAQDVGDQRRGGRLAVGAGNGDERRVGRQLGALAAEQLDVADDLDAGGLGLGDRPVRRGMRERHARRQHQRRKPRPVRARQILDGKARRRRRIAARWRCRRRRPPSPRRRPAPGRWRCPEMPSPNTATVRPANVVMGVIGSSGPTFDEGV